MSTNTSVSDSTMDLIEYIHLIIERLRINYCMKTIAANGQLNLNAKKIAISDTCIVNKNV